jgi:hypothetical protein
MGIIINNNNNNRMPYRLRVERVRQRQLLVKKHHRRDNSADNISARRVAQEEEEEDGPMDTSHLLLDDRVNRRFQIRVGKIFAFFSTSTIIILENPAVFDDMLNTVLGLPKKGVSTLPQTTFPSSAHRYQCPPDRVFF